MRSGSCNELRLGESKEGLCLFVLANFFESENWYQPVSRAAIKQYNHRKKTLKNIIP